MRLAVRSSAELKLRCNNAAQPQALPGAAQDGQLPQQGLPGAWRQGGGKASPAASSPASLRLGSSCLNVTWKATSSPGSRSLLSYRRLMLMDCRQTLVSPPGWGVGVAAILALCREGGAQVPCAPLDAERAVGQPAAAITRVAKAAKRTSTRLQLNRTRQHPQPYVMLAAGLPGVRHAVGSPVGWAWCCGPGERSLKPICYDVRKRRICRGNAFERLL